MIGWRGDNIELRAISDKYNRKSCLLLINRDSVRGFLLDSAAMIVGEFGIERGDHEKLAGGFIKDNNIYIYLHDEHSGKLHNWICDLRTGEKKDRNFPAESKTEKIVERVSGGDRFLYFTADRKTFDLSMYDIHDEKTVDTFTYHFEDKIWKYFTKNNHSGRPLNVSAIDHMGNCSAEIAQVPNKIYFAEDSLYLLMNDEKGITRIYSFDIQRRQANSRVIQHNDRNVSDSVEDGYTDNSYLLNGKLYFISATRDSLWIQVTDFASGLLLKNYAVGRDEEIKFKNTPIIQEGGAFSSGGKRELGSTSQLIRKIVNGKAVISATSEDNGVVCLSIGSYQEVTAGSGGGGGMFMPLAGGTPMVYAQIAPFSGAAGWSKSVHFKMLLDANSFEHIGGELGPGFTEKIDTYTKGVDTEPEGETLFMNYGRHVLGYYDRGWHKLVVAGF